jgi:PTS system mannose-specific IID component
VFQALILALWATFCIYDTLGPTLIYAGRPLIAGTVAGMIVGDPTLGLAIGGTLELTALGVYTYGGATIPDYPTGAIVGTALAAEASGGFSAQLAVGLALGIPAAVLLSALDPIGRFIPTFVAVQAGRGAVANLQDAIPDGFTTGMTLVGGMLPAVGFAMLLRIMPVKRYWYMLPLGFVLFAYLQVPLQGIAIFGVAIAAMFMALRYGARPDQPQQGAAHV